MTGLIRMFGLSIVLPLVVIQWQLHRGAPPLEALGLAAFFPVLEMIIEAIQTKRVGIIALVALIGIASGLGAAYVTGNVAFALLKDSVFTGAFGVVFLGSQLTEKPHIYRLNLDIAGTKASARAAAEALWERPSARRNMRLMTITWGIGLIAEAVARVIAVVMLPAVTATAVSPVIQVVFFGGLILWTILFSRRAQRAAATSS
jgi:intracellular septation protein A